MLLSIIILSLIHFAYKFFCYADLCSYYFLKESKERLSRILLIFLPYDVSRNVIKRIQQFYDTVFACRFNDSLLSFGKPCVLERLVITNHTFIFKQNVINFAVFVFFLPLGRWFRQTLFAFLRQRPPRYK